MSNRLDNPFEFYELTKKEQRQLLEWCGELGKVKTINKYEDSYTIKHLFEKSENGFYIHNGAMKGAMMSSGFDWHMNENSKNLKFNVSQRSINNFYK